MRVCKQWNIHGGIEQWSILPGRATCGHRFFSTSLKHFVIRKYVHWQAPEPTFSDIIVYHVQNKSDRHYAAFAWHERERDAKHSLRSLYVSNTDEMSRRIAVAHKHIEFSCRIVHWLYYICCCCCCYYYNSLIGSRERPLYSSSCCISYLKAYSFRRLLLHFIRSHFVLVLSLSPSFITVSVPLHSPNRWMWVRGIQAHMSWRMCMYWVTIVYARLRGFEHST